MPMDQNRTLTGTVLRIERTSIHDGQGLRTVLFLKGCPLECRWCSTPESQGFQPEKGYMSERCTGCGTCVQACLSQAITIPQGSPGIIIDQTKCKDCFVCVDKCPKGALKKYGNTMSVEQVMKEICKDEIFYFHSGGGITISGGEPLSQPGFVAEILRQCRSLGIHTAIETSLYAPWESIEKVLPWLDVLYVDIKHMDGGLHKQWVGADNETILCNLGKIDGTKYPLEIIVRIPMIPGVNDTDTNLMQAVQFCSSLKKLKDIELLPYHRLGTDTYRHLGREYSLKDLLPPSRDRISERKEYVAKLLKE